MVSGVQGGISATRVAQGKTDQRQTDSPVSLTLFSNIVVFTV